MIKFQSTHPLRGATAQVIAIQQLFGSFQSTHPLRGATADQARRQALQRFQSTHPLRGATVWPAVCIQDHEHFNPRTPCGVRHGLRGGVSFLSYFNPRTPCGVRRWMEWKTCTWYGFQSTHPLRGATNCHTGVGNLIGISIHAPLAGCDGRVADPDQIGNISIHAPLAGCDQRGQGGRVGGGDFNPRTPCGVRPFRIARQFLTSLFQSTHPLRGATMVRPQLILPPSYFNPRTPCGVRPARRKRRGQGLYDFNPRTPCGVRPCVLTPMYS